MKLVGLCSTYKEGSLARMAIASALRACDQVFVFEGPAGPPIEADVPETDLTPLPGLENANVVIRDGVWKTDAAKRTAMIKATRGLGPGPIWAVWVDGDEVLENGEYLRDFLQAVLWKDEAEGGVSGGFPIRIVEGDGSVAVCRAKVVRADQIDHYLVSSSGIVFRNGHTLVEHAEGNLPDRISAWYTPPRLRAIQDDRRMLEPPLPGEPYLVHRSRLRHPDRRGVRMHVQEGEELRRLGLVAP